MNVWSVPPYTQSVELSAQPSPRGPTSKHLCSFFVNIHIQMQIHCGIWAWFISLLQSACPQQDCVLRIKGYTIWKRSICHLSLMIARFLLPSWTQLPVLNMLMVFMPFQQRESYKNNLNRFEGPRLVFNEMCNFAQRCFQMPNIMYSPQLLLTGAEIFDIC